MLSHDTKDVLVQFWRDIDSPLSNRLADAVLQDEWELVTKLISSLDQQKWMNAYRHLRARLSIDIIKKADYLPLDIDQGRACVEAFIKAEELCRATNHRFRRVEMQHAAIPNEKLTLVSRVKREIRRMIGPIPDMLYHQGTFGPGATLSNSRSRSSIFEKLASIPTITQECVWFYPALPARLRDCWGPEDQLTCVTANRFVMVPKNYKTHRGICIEPLINAYVQRGFGLHIKNRLRKFNIDIDTASDRHRNLARLGSVDGSIATLDMSMASDTIANDMLRVVLPRDWYVLLNACRSRFTDLESVYDDYYNLFLVAEIDQVHKLEKFSSMGNGFTFELETLLFTAIARACGDKTATSFGDDLVVQAKYVDSVLDALKFFGFVPNVDKSFSHGSFRESCGGDYRNGVPVKGETLKTEPRCVDDWFNLHNRLFLMSQSYGIDLSRTLNRIRNKVPKRLRFEIPVYLGGGGFFSEKPRGRYVNGIERYRTYRRKRIQSSKDWYERFSEDVMLAAIFLGGTSFGPNYGTREVWKVEWVPAIE